MTQNLRLVGSRTLTSANSDVTSNFTLPASAGGVWDNTSAHIYYNNNTTYGAYYNWYAATAGTGVSTMTSGNAASSICPKGFRLPTITGNKSFYNLLTTKYSIPDGSGNNSLSKMIVFPFNMEIGGDYYDGGLYRVGEYLNYWTSTAATDSSGIPRARSIWGEKSTGNVGLRNTYYKVCGYSVRCVSK